MPYSCPPFFTGFTLECLTFNPMGRYAREIDYDSGIDCVSESPFIYLAKFLE